MIFKVKCPDCEGIGQILELCKICSGNGVIKQGKHYKRCENCNGTGYITKICNSCKGKGFLTMDAPDWFLKVLYKFWNLELYKVIEREKSAT